jgi:hypothetical protein
MRSGSGLRPASPPPVQMRRDPARARSALALLCSVVIAACVVSPPPSPAPLGPVTPSPTAGGPRSAGATTIPSAGSSPTALPSPTTSPAAGTATLRWTKTVTDLPSSVARAGITALAMRPGNPPTYMAISSDHRTWLSSDGVQWRRGGKMASAEGGDVWWVCQLFVANGTFVAFGTAATLSDAGLDGPYSGLNAGFVWTSTDGESWDRTRIDTFAVASAALDAGGFVATGGLTGQYRPTFATSADWRTWSRVSLADDPWPGEPTTFDWHDVRSLAGSANAGYLVLDNQIHGGSAACQGLPPAGGDPQAPTSEAETPIVWRSLDLQHWAPVATAKLACSYMTQLIAGPAGDLAMSTMVSQTSRAVAVRAWVSSDGVAWHEIEQPPGPLDRLGSLAMAPDGTFLALGDGVWASVDGERWSLSAPATGLNVEEFAGDLAIACGHDECVALHAR